MKRTEGIILVLRSQEYNVRSIVLRVLVPVPPLQQQEVPEVWLVTVLNTDGYAYYHTPFRRYLG